MKKILTCFVIFLSYCCQLNTVNATEHIPIGCDASCQHELQILQWRWDDLKRDYETAFGDGTFSSLNLEMNYANLNIIRPLIVARCQQNSDSKLSQCEEILKAKVAGETLLCAELASVIPIPLMQRVIRATCAGNVVFKLSNIPQVCGMARVEGRVDCFN